MAKMNQIADLKGMGHDIVSERGSSKNRYGEQTSYSVYRLRNKEVKAWQKA